VPSAPAWYQDYIGDAFVGAGVVTAAIGIVLYNSALSARDAADHAGSYQATQDQLDRASTDRNFAVILSVSATALVAGGIVHYVLHTGSSESTIAVTPTTVTWARRF
jgi:hypothetical protein